MTMPDTPRHPLLQVIGDDPARGIVWVCTDDHGPYPSVPPTGEHDDSTLIQLPLVVARRFAADTDRLATVTHHDTPVLRERPDGRFDIIDGDAVLDTLDPAPDGTVVITGPWQWQVCDLPPTDGMWRTYTLSVMMTGPYPPADAAILTHPAIVALGSFADRILAASLEYNDTDRVSVICDRRLPHGETCTRLPGHDGTCSPHPDPTTDTCLP